jgi:hypothetical protein
MSHAPINVKPYQMQAWRIKGCVSEARGQMEQRRHDRQRLGTPTKFYWKTAQGRRRRGVGVARDFSAVGVFVTAADLPPLGVNIDFEIDLSASVLNSKTIIEAKGCVNRLEAHDSVHRLGGFAIDIRRIRLKRNRVIP